MLKYDQSELSARQDLIGKLAEAARSITLPLFKKDMAVVNKAEGRNYDPVTEADIEAERVMRELILSAFPYDSIEGEELSDIYGSNEWLWTLDPIDGTRGFVAGIPVWSTLIAVSFKNNPILGLIDVAAQDKQFFGSPNYSWLIHEGREKKLSSRNCGGDLTKAILGCTEPLAMLNESELRVYNNIRKIVRFSRLGLDAYAYGQIALGKMDVVIEALLKPCDVRALVPVIEGAGGKLTNWEGGSAVNGGSIIAVGDPLLLPKIIDILKAGL